MIDIVPASASGALGLSLLGAVLSASLLGSIHCAGMCGPFVAVYSAAGPRGSKMKRQRALSHVAYHGTRAVGYIGLGALSGALGRGLDSVGNVAGITHLAAIVCGTLVVLWGASVLLPGLGLRSPVSRFLGPQLARLGTKPRVYRASLLGALTPLLPCGWLYAFVVMAGGTGSITGGALLMATFWLGTVPALFGVGVVFSHIGERLRARIPVLSGVALIIIGVLGIAYRVSLPSPSESAVPSGAGLQVPNEDAKCH